MDALKLKTILDISLGFLIFIGAPGISAGLWLNRYNRRKEQGKTTEEPQELEVDQINKTTKGRVKKKS